MIRIYENIDVREILNREIQSYTEYEDTVRRIVADVLGIPVELPAVEEGPAYGAAMLAMAACGAYASAAEAAKALVRVRERILPDAGERQGYEEGYATYRRLYPALKGIFPQMKR